MKKKYISPAILLSCDIDISILAHTVHTNTGNTDDSGANVNGPESGSTAGDGTIVPDETKGTSWNLWDDEEEYY